MSQKQLIIIGDGEFAAIAHEYFTYDSPYEVIAFCVEKDFYTQETYRELPVYTIESLPQKYTPGSIELFIAITFTKLNTVRERLYLHVKSLGYTCATYISSRAFVWSNVIIGDNCFIFENNTLQPFVTIGNNVILWSGNHIGHQSVIKDHVFLSSHVVVSGYCCIEERSFIGVNSTLADHICIAKDNFIAMASTINKNTTPNTIYRGSPAEPSRMPARRYFKIHETT